MDLTQPSTGEILFPRPENLRKLSIQLSAAPITRKGGWRFAYMGSPLGFVNSDGPINDRQTALLGRRHELGPPRPADHRSLGCWGRLLCPGYQNSNGRKWRRPQVLVQVHRFPRLSSRVVPRLDGFPPVCKEFSPAGLGTRHSGSLGAAPPMISMKYLDVRTRPFFWLFLQLRYHAFSC